MKRALCATFAWLPLALAGCAAHAPDETSSDTADAEEADTAATLGTYFVATHPDLRRCAWPLCGGVYVKRAGRTTTRCADGSYASECRVLFEDLSGASITGDDADEIARTFEQGHVILRGAIVSRDDRGTTVPALAATEAWVGNALAAPDGRFYLVADNGVRCVRAPCPHLDERRLDYAARRAIDGVDLEASGANDKQVAAGIAALAGDGVIVAGWNLTTRATGTTLVASEFYTRVPASRPPVCGGIAGFQCPDGLMCDVTTPNACHGADLMGACIVRPQACYHLFAPVCGCDGVTYGNDCWRQRAGVQLDHDGACE